MTKKEFYNKYKAEFSSYEMLEDYMSINSEPHKVITTTKIQNCPDSDNRKRVKIEQYPVESCARAYVNYIVDMNRPAVIRCENFKPIEKLYPEFKMRNSPLTQGNSYRLSDTVIIYPEKEFFKYYKENL